MSDTYTTIGGEVIDQIALRHYGSPTGSTELILGANPGLAERPVMLPPGVQINLPALPASPSVRPVRLYD